MFSTENAGCFCFLWFRCAFPRTFSPPRTHEYKNRRTGFSRRTAVLGFSCSRVRGGGYKQASPSRSHTTALPHPTYTLEMTNFSVVDKLALVTGSTRGLGRVLAQGLIEAGARVVVHGSDAQRAEAAAAELGACGFMACDVRDAVATEAAVSEVIERFGAPDILVNNAGIQRRNPIEVFEDQDWNDIVGVNLSGVFHVTRPVASAMKTAGRGKIVMVGSVQSRLGRATIAPYCATKGGVAMFAQGLAAELSPFNVQVNTLSPGYFDTDMNAALVADEEFSGWVCKRTPAGRWGDPRELVGPLLFLASEASSFVTGQNLAVDGGMTAVV
ncbi:gluconate 5-dehydrogenase [Corynebacterium diphtheriae HC03]|nr:gluconate 5-dehydrogenase [Corynebacterium diphtheriae HC03]